MKTYLDRGEDKAFFYIFDYCGNMEYFGENPEGVKGNEAEPLSKKIFKHRLQLIEEIQDILLEGSSGVGKPGSGDFGDDAEDLLKELRLDTIDILYKEVSSMNVDNFIVRAKRRYVDRFQNRETWNVLDVEKMSELYHHIAGLPTEQETEDITAKLFDLTCLKLQLALVEKSVSFQRLKQKVQEMASDLEYKETIPMVKAQMDLILDVQTDEYWQDITLPIIENLRKKLRDPHPIHRKEEKRTCIYGSSGRDRRRGRSSDRVFPSGDQHKAIQEKGGVFYQGEPGITWLFKSLNITFLLRPLTCLNWKDSSLNRVKPRVKKCLKRFTGNKNCQFLSDLLLVLIEKQP